MLKFAFFGLIGILLVTILTWISYLDSFHFHLGFTSFVYFVTWLTSCENDWELMGDRLSPGSEESQAVSKKVTYPSRLSDYTSSHHRSVSRSTS